jgi:hypothetical protein
MYVLRELLLLDPAPKEKPAGSAQSVPFHAQAPVLSQVLSVSRPKQNWSRVQ